MHSFRNNYLVLLLALIIGLVLRLFLAWNYKGNFDQESYEIVADIMNRGGNVYAETYRYNYSPLWFHILHLLSIIHSYTNVEYHFIVRAFLSCCDLGVSFLVMFLANRVTQTKSILPFILYWLNPVSILIIGFHGQFDILSQIPLLLATVLLLGVPNPDTHNDAKKRTPIALILCSASLLLKHISMFQCWVYLYYSQGLKRALILISVCFAIFLLSFAPYIAEARGAIIGNVFMYSGAQIPWGISSFIPIPRKLALLTLISVMSLLPWFAKSQLRLSLPRAMELCGVTFLMMTPGFGDQFLILPLVWGAVNHRKAFYIYSLIAGIYLAGSDSNIHISYLTIPRILVWGATVIWFLSFLWPIIKEAGKKKNSLVPA